METVTLTLTGKNLGDLAAQAMTFAQTAQGGVKIGAAPSSTVGKTGGKKAAQSIDEDIIDETETEEIEALGSDDIDETENFDGAEDEIEEEKPAKKTAGKKLTEKDVNQAALAHAKEHGRPATLKVLKAKFKVGSIQELKPAQYADAVKALKV